MRVVVAHATDCWGGSMGDTVDLCVVDIPNDTTMAPCHGECPAVRAAMARAHQLWGASTYWTDAHYLDVCVCAPDAEEVDYTPTLWA